MHQGNRYGGGNNQKGEAQRQHTGRLPPNHDTLVHEIITKACNMQQREQLARPTNVLFFSIKKSSNNNKSETAAAIYFFLKKRVFYLDEGIVVFRPFVKEPKMQ